jgi:hypothetical protein
MLAVATGFVQPADILYVLGASNLSPWATLQNNEQQACSNATRAAKNYNAANEQLHCR